MNVITLALVACIAFGVVIADVSHLTKQYVQPGKMMPISATKEAVARPNNMERIVTTIEKQELRELPTQTEYLQPGQMPYGIGLQSSRSKNNQNGIFAGGHAKELSLEMMMPRELLAPPPQPPQKQAEQPAVPPSNQYLTSMEMEQSTKRTNPNSMPIRQYLAPPMNLSDKDQQMGTATAHSNQYTAAEINVLDQQETPQQQTAPMSTPTKEYLTPPNMRSVEQQVQQQSAPVARYLPPQQQQQQQQHQQQIPEMPTSQYLPPQVQRHQMQMQMQMQKEMQPTQYTQTPPASHYLPPALKMSPPLMDVMPQMQSPPSQYLSPFGEIENVAEAAQEAAQEVTEMFDEQLAKQPTPPPAIEEPANYYLPPPMPSAAQQLNYQQQSEQLAPVDFISQHQRLMTQFGSGGGGAAAMNFAQFQSKSPATPTLQMPPASMPGHLLANDGYHYRDVGNSIGLSNANTNVGRFHLRQ